MDDPVFNRRRTQLQNQSWVRCVAEFCACVILLLVCLPGRAQAGTALEQWRADIDRVRNLAENDAPRADREARILQAALSPEATPADTVRALNLRSRTEVYTAQPEAAASHAQQALELATQHADRVGQAEAYLNISLNSVNLGKIDQLIDAAPRALELLQGVERPDLQGEAMLRMAMMYLRLGKLDESVTLCMQAMDIAQRSKHPMALLYAHQGLGIAFTQSGRDTEAREHFTQMRDLARTLQVKQLEADAMNGIASTTGQRGDWHAAELLLREAVVLYRSVGVPFNIGHGLYALANSLRQQGMLTESLQALDEAMGIYERSPNQIGLWWTLNARSDHLQALGRLGLAKRDAERAYALAQQLDVLLYRSDSARRMATVSAALGEHKLAYQFSAQALDLAEKMAQEKANVRVGELANMYHNDSRQRKIDELSRLEMQRNLEQRWLWTVLGGSMVVLGLTVFFLLRLRRSHRLLESTNAHLHQSQKEIRALNVELEQRVQLRTDELRQQTRYLRTLIDGLPVWLWLKDTEGRYLTVNVSIAALHGYTPQQMIGQNDEALLLDQSGGSFRDSDIEVMQTRQRKTWERAVVNVDGEISWHEIDKLPVMDIDGTVLGTVGIGRDITERKRMEDQLAQRERDFRSLANNLPDNVARWDARGRYVYVNPNSERSIGRRSEEVIGKRPNEAFPDGSFSPLDTAIDKVIATKQPVSFVRQSVSAENGEIRFYDVNLMPELDNSGCLVSLLGIGRDMTTIYRMQEAIEAREKEFRSLAENLPVAVIRYDCEHRRSYLNPAAEQLLHGNAAEFLDHSPGGCRIAETPSMLECYWNTMDEVLATGHARDMDWVSDALPAERQKYYDVRFVPEHGEGGKAVGVLAIWRDVTERKKFELALLARAELEERQSQFFSVAPGFFYTTVRHPDGQYEITFASSGIRELLGLEQEAVMQDSSVLFGVAHPDDMEMAARKSEESERDLSPYHIEYRIMHPAKGVRWMEVHLLTQRLPDGGTRWDGFMHDITERKRLEEQVAQRERDFRSLADNMPDNVTRWDVEGRYLYLNPVHARTLGAAASDMIGKVIPDSHVNVKAAIAQAVATGQSRLMVQQPVPDENGDVRLHDVSIVPERDEAGQIVSVLGIGRDMTEIYRMQEAIATREQAFRSLAESSPDFITRYDREGRHLYFNDRLLKLLGLANADEALGKRPSEVWPDGRFAELEQVVARAMESGNQGEIEVVQPADGGGFRYHQIFVVPERDAGGQVIGAIAFGREITAIREGERKLAHFIDNLPGMVYTFRTSPDGQGSFPYVSPAIEEFYGLKPEDVKDDMAPIHALAHPDDRPRIEAAMAEAERTQMPLHFESRVCLPGQPERWLDVRAVPERQVDGNSLWYGLMLDITERKHIEQALSLSEQEFRSLAENLPVAVIRYDSEHRRRYLNRAAEGMLHGTAADLLGQPPGGHTVPATPVMVGRYLSEMKEVLATGAARDLVLVFDALPAEKQEHYEVRFVPEHGAGGQVTGVLAIWYDITERKRMEDQLAARTQEFRALAENSPDTIARYVQGGIRTYINPAFVRLSGKPAHEMLGVTAADFQASPAAHTYQRVLLLSLESGEQGEFEYTWPTQDGSMITSHIRIVPEFGAGGKVVSVLAVGRDITERKHLENELKQREAAFRALAENLPAPVFRYDRDCRRIYVNPAAERVTRTPSDQLIGYLPVDSAAVESDSAVRAMQAIREVFATGERRTIYVEYLGEDGSTSEYQGVLVPEFNATGQVASVLSIAHEVTSLREAERRAASFFANMPGFAYTFVISPEGRMRFPFASRGIKEIFGLNPEDVRDDAAPMRALAHPADWQRVEAAIIEASQTLQPFDIEARMQRPGYPVRWIECHSMPERQVNGEVLWHGVMLDVTERKRMEVDLADSRNFLETVINSISDPISVKDSDHRWILLNDTCCAMIGQPREMLIGKSDYDFLPKEQADVFWEKDDLVYWSGEVNLNEEVLTAADGSTRHLLTQKSPFTFSDGQRYVVATSRDITERKQAQERMELLEFAIDLSSDAIYLIDENLRFNYVNAFACRTLGYSQEELLAMGPTGIDPDIDLDAARHLMNSSPLGTAVNFETRHRTRDGRTFPVEIIATHFERDGVKFSLSVARDITERKQMELSLKESEARYRYHFNLLQSMLESSSSVSVFALDRQYRYLFFNQKHRDGAKRLRGTEIAIGMNMLESMNDEVFREFCRQGFDRVLAGHVLFVESKETVVRDGQQGFEYNDNYGSPIFNDDGEVVGLTVFAINTTERKLAEEKRNELQRQLQMQKEFQDTLLNALNEVGLQMMLIENNRIVYVSNRKLANELGYTDADIEAQPFLMNLIHPDDRERIAGYQRSRMTGQTWPSYYELSLVSRDGKRHEYETSIAVLPGSDPLRIITIGKDITERKRMQEMLRDSHRFLYNIIDTIADPIFVKDRQHRWLHLNDAFCRFIGHSREELIGKSDFDFFPEQEARVFWEGDEAVFTSGQEFTNEEEFTNSAGETRYIFTRKTLYSGTDQQPLLVGIIADFTDRKRMEDELHLREQKFRTLAENAPDNIVRYDRAGRIVYVNPVLERTLGVRKDAILGTHARENPSGGQFDVYVDMLDQVLASGEDGEIEMTLPDTPDGPKVHHIRLVAERNEAGDIVGVLAIGRDITELKRYEAARDAALAEAVRLAKARSEFLSQMSHELRTPLNSILGYTQILQRDKDLGERNADALKVMRQSGEHLLALVEDILDLARIEAGRLALDVSEISLDTFLRGVSDIVSIRAREKGIEFSCVLAHDLPTDIRADEKRLRQVLLNLLANAIKFTHHGRVVLHVSRVSALRLAFVVEDTGVGIAAHELEAIFQPFEQSGEASQRFGGSGLGLSISRQLMRLMGGDIWVESRLGVGSKFGFELTWSAAQEKSASLFVADVADMRRESSGKTEFAADLDQPMLVPPVENLKALQHLAQLGNMRDIVEYIDTLVAMHPVYRPFIAQLRQMAQTYQSQALLAFINEYLHDANTA